MLVDQFRGLIKSKLRVYIRNSDGLYPFPDTNGAFLDDITILWSEKTRQYIDVPTQDIFVPLTETSAPLQQVVDWLYEMGETFDDGDYASTEAG